MDDSTRVVATARAREGSSPPEEDRTHEFVYQFRSNGTEYRLKVPLEPSPRQRDARELALR